MNEYKQTLPKIQSVRNRGFAGKAIHQVHKPARKMSQNPFDPQFGGGEFVTDEPRSQPRQKPKFEKRQCMPVNHFITNHNINININNNYTINVNSQGMETSPRNNQGDKSVTSGTSSPDSPSRVARQGQQVPLQVQNFSNQLMIPDDQVSRNQ